jgi:hypothetical protein
VSREPTSLADTARLGEAFALRAQLLAHPIYTRVTTAGDARRFMEIHCFAVWDFMSLLKSLQRRLTCVELPWLPPIDVNAARLINEIVLAEESDEDGRGRYAGHYDLYVEAMGHVGADHRPIERFVNALRAHVDVERAFVVAGVPDAARAFVRTTLDIAMNGKTHEVASAFFLGREDVIPSMFDQLRASLAGEPRLIERLSYYLSRHVEIDGDKHGPAAERLLRALCDEDAEKWRDANAAACRSLRARIALWDGVVASLDR